MFNPDLEIIDEEDDEKDVGSAWCLQHQGCGQKGLVVRATNSFFSPTKDIMDHHRKGEKKREKCWDGLKVAKAGHKSEGHMGMMADGQ